MKTKPELNLSNVSVLISGMYLEEKQVTVKVLLGALSMIGGGPDSAVILIMAGGQYRTMCT